MKKVNLNDLTARMAFLSIFYDMDDMYKSISDVAPSKGKVGTYNEKSLKKMRNVLSCIEKYANSLVDIIDNYLLSDTEGGEA